MVKIMFICIYQPIYTILFGMVHCNLCTPTAILGDLSVVGDLIVLLRQTRGDPTALPQEGVPTAFVLSMFKVRAVSRRSLEMPQRSLRLDGAQVSNCQIRTSLIDTANLKHCRTPPLFTAYLWHNTASTLSSCQP